MKEKSFSFGPDGLDHYTSAELDVRPLSWREANSIWSHLMEESCRIKKLTAGCIDWEAQSTWHKYRNAYRSKRSSRTLIKKFQTEMIPNLPNANMPCEHIITLYFTLGIPVPTPFLKKLRKEAFVELIGDRCISKVLQKNGKFQLGEPQLDEMKTIEDAENAVAPPRFPVKRRRAENVAVDKKVEEEEEEEMTSDDIKTFECLVEAVSGFGCEKGWVKTSYFNFWRRLQTTKMCEKTALQLRRRYEDYLIHRIHAAPIDEKSKVKLYFALDLPLDTTFAYILEENAEIQISNDRRIYEYRRFDGSLTLCYPTPSTFTQKEDEDLLRYICGLLRDPDTGKINSDKHLMNRVSVYSDYVRDYNLLKNPSRYCQRLGYLCEHLHVLTFLPPLFKVALYYGLKIPVEQDYLKKLREVADFVTDADGVIMKFKEKKTNSSANPSTWKSESEYWLQLPSETLEEVEMWQYVLRQSRTTKNRKIDSFLSPNDWFEFSRQKNYSTSPDKLADKFRNEMVENLHKTSFKDEVKLELYKCIGCQVDPCYLARVSQYYVLKVDNQQRLIEYESRSSGGKMLISSK